MLDIFVDLVIVVDNGSFASSQTLTSLIVARRHQRYLLLSYSLSLSCCRPPHYYYRVSVRKETFLHAGTFVGDIHRAID